MRARRLTLDAPFCPALALSPLLSHFSLSLFFPHSLSLPLFFPLSLPPHTHSSPPLPSPPPPPPLTPSLVWNVGFKMDHDCEFQEYFCTLHMLCCSWTRQFVNKFLNSYSPFLIWPIFCTREPFVGLVLLLKRNHISLLTGVVVFVCVCVCLNLFLWACYVLVTAYDVSDAAELDWTTFYTYVVPCNARTTESCTACCFYRPRDLKDWQISLNRRGVLSGGSRGVLGFATWKKQ